MKELKVFILKGCPYCQIALKALDKAMFKDVNVIVIDERENPEIAEQYDYYYVPTFYLDGVKIHEGVIDKKEAERLVSSI